MSEMFRKHNKLLLGIFSLLVILIGSQQFAQILQYDRSSILNGEYWRILTCHFTHVSVNHLLLNVTGIILVFILFHRLYTPQYWFLGILCCGMSIGISFLIFVPAIEWYMGLSGVLHGLFVIGLLGEIRQGHKIYWLGILALIGKLTMEHFADPTNLSSQFINAFIITDAHLSGSISGAIIFLICYIKKTLNIPDSLASKPVS